MNTLSYIQVPLVRTLLLSKSLFVDGLLRRLCLTIDTLLLVNRLLDLPRDRRVPEFVFLERPYFSWSSTDVAIPHCRRRQLPTILIQFEQPQIWISADFSWSSQKRHEAMALFGFDPAVLREPLSPTFLDLPLEIREWIYDFAGLIRNCTLDLNVCNAYKTLYEIYAIVWPTDTIPYLAIVSSYRFNSFEFWSRSRKKQGNFGTLGTYFRFLQWSWRL
jgi:hypothetical protein